MKQVEWGRRIASMLAALILLVGAACVTNAEDLSRIVVFRAGTSLQAQQDAVERSGSRVLQILSLINGLAIELPPDRAVEALRLLEAESSVVGLYANPKISAQGQVVVSAEGAGGDGAGGDGAGGDGAGGDGAGGDLVVRIHKKDPPTSEEYPWGLVQIGVPEVQEYEPGLAGAGVTIAIADTGIDRQHPEFKGSIVGCVNVLAEGAQDDCQDDNGHGTHIAGIIAARLDKYGVIGPAHRAKLFVIKVLGKDGAGQVSNLISGLGWVLANRIKLVNMSLGFPQEWASQDPEAYKALEIATQALVDAGVIMVAAAGNTNPRDLPPSLLVSAGAGGDGAGGDGAGGDGAGGDGTCSQLAAQGAGGDGAGGDGAGGDGAGGDEFTLPCYQTTQVKFPAAYPWVIAVGATGSPGTSEYGLPTGYSRWGPELAQHGVVAPGGSTSGPGILSTYPGGYGVSIGSSQATAHVTGTLAIALQLNPRLTFAELLALLWDTAVDVFPNTDAPVKWELQGAGLIDVGRMVDALKSWGQGRDDDRDNEDKKEEGNINGKD